MLHFFLYAAERDSHALTKYNEQPGNQPRAEISKQLLPKHREVHYSYTGPVGNLRTPKSGFDFEEYASHC
jgi:hypothetical protein